MHAHAAFEAVAIPNGKSVTSCWSIQVSEKLLEVAVRLFQLLAAGRSRDTQENQNRTIQAHHVLVGEPADTRADFRFWNGRDLIHHQSADGPQTVGLTRLDRQTKQRSNGWVSGECTHRDGIRHVETVVLEDHNGTELSRVVFATCNRPNFPAPQLVPRSETASIKS